MEQRDKLEELTSAREREICNKKETAHMKGRNQVVNTEWERQYGRNWFVIHRKLVRS